LQEVWASQNSLTLVNDKKGKQDLAVALNMFYDTMKVYGKDAGQLESATKMFNFVLADYQYNKIRQALAYYARHYSEMPTPADIATIIERGNKPPFDKAVYTSISKKRPDERTGDDWEYMRDYERFMMEGRY
jgi:hypothetical protein